MANRNFVFFVFVRANLNSWSSQRAPEHVKNVNSLLSTANIKAAPWRNASNREAAIVPENT